MSYPSKDGTRGLDVPRPRGKGLKPDGETPFLLYGYGGFNVSDDAQLLAAASARGSSAGGVYAVPNLRGGGEYGEAWHRAGMLDRKQNVFDDFVAAAEYLMRSG